MWHRLSLTLAAVALLGAACSQASETVVVGSNDSTKAVVVATSTTSPPAIDEPTTVPGERPTSMDSTTVAADVEPEPDPVETTKPVQSWDEHPLARVILTEADMPSLGLDSGWEFRWIDFIELDPADHVDEKVCGADVPVQPSYFVTSFDDASLGVELQLNVMPDIGGTAASDYLHTLERLVDCPNPEPQYADVSVEIVTIEIEGAEQSLVIAGADESSPGEPLGQTLAAAEVDGHLFIAFVEQDGGVPANGDAELAVRAVELSISRL